MGRGILLVLDSVGIGASADAPAYGDVGADTLGHIALGCAEGRGDRAGLRSGVLALPNLDALGLGAAAEAATGRVPPGLTGARQGAKQGRWGFAQEVSAGKDTPSGHWELAGTPVPFAWGYFPEPSSPVSRATSWLPSWPKPGSTASSATGTARAPP